MPTPKQEKVIKLIVENAGKLGKRKSKGEILAEAGYGSGTIHNPKRVFESETIQEGLEDFVKMLDDKRRLAITHINQTKLEKSSARDLAYIADTFTKNHQLLTGKETERGAVRISGFNYLKPNDPNNSTNI